MSPEKRSSPRFPSDVRLRSCAEADEVMEMETVNLSAGGAYCTTRTRIEPMTRMQVEIDLPGRTASSMPLEATAVVVRVEEPRGDGRYRLALWFQGMSKRDRARLRLHLGLDGD